MASLLDYERELLRRNAELEAQAAASEAALQKHQAPPVCGKEEASVERVVKESISELLAGVQDDVGSRSPAGEAQAAEQPSPETSARSAAQDQLPTAGSRTPGRTPSGSRRVSASGSARNPPLASRSRRSLTGTGGTTPARPSESGEGNDLDVPSHPEATVRLHKARIRALSAELATSQEQLKERSKRLEAAEKELQELKREKASWNKAQKAQELQLEKYKRAAEDARNKLDAKENMVKELSKDGFKVERERRNVEAEVKARDVRLNRALEEVERYKRALEEVKSHEREGKDSVKVDLQKVYADCKKLERQKAELIVAFKKQIKLIDVLKRQKIHLEAARVLAFTEDEFMKALDMNQA
ncbi:hypothetical protein WJX72_001356 [[Myrmecia] bisecta]|uniref:Testis-expressed sequence 9 protein n=1 Tax=[Myrmecia] bisecta TaxID=41462 RepID=A0AAW1Q5H6_9CHLO